MPVRKVQRVSITDLSPRIQARVRIKARLEMVAQGPSSLPGSTDPSAPRNTQGGNDAAMGSGPFVMVDYPVSANRYWRNFKGRTVVSSEARAYKDHISLLWKSMGLPLHIGPVCVSILLHPRLTKKGEESRSRIDLDNCIKVAIDALNGVAFADDKQVRRLIAEVADPVEGGALSVRVTA